MVQGFEGDQPRDQAANSGKSPWATVVSEGDVNPHEPQGPLGPQPETLCGVRCPPESSTAVHLREEADLVDVIGSRFGGSRTAWGNLGGISPDPRRGPTA
jgi:hypothetical protein